MSGQVGHSPGILTTTLLRRISRARNITLRRIHLVVSRGQAGSADTFTAGLGGGNRQVVGRADRLAGRLGQVRRNGFRDGVGRSRLVATSGNSQRRNGEEKEVLHGV